MIKGVPNIKEEKLGSLIAIEEKSTKNQLMQQNKVTDGDNSVSGDEQGLVQ